MTQQVFSATKNGDAFYSSSHFGVPGFFYQSVPVQYQLNDGQEFWIYHGEGAEPINNKFNFSITLKEARAEDKQLLFPCQIKLFNPAEKLVRVWNMLEKPGTKKTFNFPEQQVDGLEILNYGWWRCLVLLTEPNLPAFIYFDSGSYIRKALTKEVTLSYRWLGHSFWNVLNVLMPQVTIAGNKIILSAAEEISYAMGRTPMAPITTTIDGLSANVQLTALTIEATNGAKILAFIKAKRDKAQADFNNEQNALKKVFANQKYQAWKTKYEKAAQKTQADNPALRIMPVFSDPRFSFSKYGIGGTIELTDQPVLFIQLGNTTSVLPPDNVCAFSEIDYTIKDLHGFEDILIAGYDALTGDNNYQKIHHLNSFIEDGIGAFGKQIMEYLFVALNKAAGQSSVVEKVVATAEGWKLTYYDTIPHPDPSTARQSVVKPNLPVQPPVGSFQTKAHTATPAPEKAAVAPKIFTGFPEGFVVEGGAALDRLDKTKTIVVIMMENRSFDHFLGDLSRNYPAVGYDCFPLDFTNAKAGNFSGPVPVCPAASLFFPDVNITPIGPDHGYYHVMNQISDGSFDITKLDPANPAHADNRAKLKTKMGMMQGFAKDIITRFNREGSNMEYPHETPRFESPQMIMTYYQKAQLPSYYFIAENFKILDKWFAAHPGPTWPNRIATHTGKLIELQNFSLTKDKRIGYFKQQTIFDVLTNHSIDWVFLESNASIMRIFDKYRIDDKHVVPLHRGTYEAGNGFEINEDDLKGLDEVLAKPVLPRVIFIEPRFSDAPPLKKAYDDLAPTDISHGQQFIQKIYNKLYGSSHAKEINLLITYDEHGGFFDHVPPPGTAYSTSGIKVPPIYEDPDDPTIKGPECMGVRVPALFVSPFVKPLSVSHTVFDHTSILKTILVHNRNQLTPQVFKSFSERVNQANHLGQVFDLDTARTMPLMTRPGLPVKIVPSGKTSYYDKSTIPDDDYHEGLRTLFMPK